MSVVKWSMDNKYILSGSMEMNIRIWKARASEKLGVVSTHSCPKVIKLFSCSTQQSMKFSLQIK